MILSRSVLTDKNTMRNNAITNTNYVNDEIRSYVLMGV
jgi:hypothetical protein